MPRVILGTTHLLWPTHPVTVMRPSLGQHLNRSLVLCVCSYDSLRTALDNVSRFYDLLKTET